ncbi:alpha/beta hydrolase fold [seawater metagenome]|uniref:Alpha/beta hydrolase fold n=1 Tax=seawater metagenome TaxID=1561972 RepID=A0A5E8CLG1_9ZZZZ
MKDFIQENVDIKLELKVKCKIYTPQTKESEGIFFFIHGGIFTKGNHEEGESICKILCQNNYHVIAMNYRQGPYNNHPTATDDITSIIEYFLKDNKGKQVGIVGVSSGGWYTINLINKFDFDFCILIAPVPSIQKRQEYLENCIAGTFNNKTYSEKDNFQYHTKEDASRIKKHQENYFKGEKIKEIDTYWLNKPKTLLIYGEYDKNIPLILMEPLVKEILKNKNNKIYCIEKADHKTLCTLEFSNASSIITDFLMG